MQTPEHRLTEKIFLMPSEYKGYHERAHKMVVNQTIKHFGVDNDEVRAKVFCKKETNQNVLTWYYFTLQDGKPEKTILSYVIVVKSSAKYGVFIEANFFSDYPIDKI